MGSTVLYGGMLMSDAVSICGSNISRLGFADVLDRCSERVDEGSGGAVIFANVHTVMECLDSPELRHAFARAFLVVADGLPLVWASRLQAPGIDSRVCGPDLMRAFLEKRTDLTHGFLGGTAGQATTIAGKFDISYASHCPPFRPFSPRFVVEDLEQLKQNAQGELPKVVWVGLGAPKQELWMTEAVKHAPETLFFGVGAAFDFLSDAKPRAPVWMQERGLEWLFRLRSEPKRLGSRYLRTNSRFVMEVAKFAGRRLVSRR